MLKTDVELNWSILKGTLNVIWINPVMKVKFSINNSYQLPLNLYLKGLNSDILVFLIKTIFLLLCYSKNHEKHSWSRQPFMIRVSSERKLLRKMQNFVSIFFRISQTYSRIFKFFAKINFAKESEEMRQFARTNRKENIRTVFLKRKKFNLVLRSKFNLFLVLMHEGDWKQVSVKSYHSVLVRYWGFFKTHPVQLETPFTCLVTFFLLKLFHLFPRPFCMYYLVQYKFSWTFF